MGDKYKVTITFDVVENEESQELVDLFLDELERVITHENIYTLIPIDSYPCVKEIKDPKVRIRKRL